MGIFHDIAAWWHGRRARRRARRRLRHAASHRAAPNLRPVAGAAPREQMVRMSAPAGRAPSAAPNDVFTPTRPRSGRRSLVGREAELERILDAVLDDHAHVVLYSERGRGKTSLANLAVESLRRRGAIVGRCACEAESSFDTMIRALVRDLPQSLLATQTIDPDCEGCESMLPMRSLRPADVAAIAQSLTCPFLVFVVDEFDRVTDGETRTRLADTIKLLSDRGTPLYFVVVGVSDTLEQIIGQHPSIQRNIVAIHLPLLRDDEIASMLSKGGQQAGISFTREAVGLVTGVARGMPYMAQLLGLRITQAALRRGDEQVAHVDLVQAVQRLLDDASSGVVNAYVALTGKKAGPNMAMTLHGLANAEQDRWGRMAVLATPAEVSVGGVRVMPALWSALLEAGVIMQPEGDDSTAQFRDRALIYHVQLRAAFAELARHEGAPEHGAAEGDDLAAPPFDPSPLAAPRRRIVTSNA
jgi:hypothetical protein